MVFEKCPEMSACAYSMTKAFFCSVNKCPWNYHNKLEETMSGLKDQLGLDLDYTLNSLQESIRSTSELLLNLPETLHGTVTEDDASK